MSAKIRVFVVGLGNMGLSHALAYTNPGFEIVGLANRSPVTLPPALQSYARFATSRKASPRPSRTSSPSTR